MFKATSTSLLFKLKTQQYCYRLTLTDLNEEVCPHVEGKTTVRALLDVFTKLTCTLYLRCLRNKGTLRKNTSVFGLSWQVVSVIIAQVCKAVIIFPEPDWHSIKTWCTEPEVTEFIIGTLCNNAWELLAAHTLRQNNRLLISTDSITERRNIFWMNRCCVTLRGHVICVQFRE